MDVPEQDALAASPRESGLKIFFYVCFFLSGATGLIYQMAWIRYLNLIFGSTTYSITTVVSAYMMGLGLGSLLVGRAVDRLGRPGVTYAVLEALIGIYALSSPLIFSLVHWSYIHIDRGLDPSLLFGSLIKFVMSFSVMLVPTILMGGTLPVLSKLFIHRLEDTQRELGYLYGMNTLGAVSGTFLFGFIFLEVLGISASIQFAAVVNLGIAVLAYSQVRKVRDAEPEKPSTKEPEASGQTGISERATLYFALAAFMLSGFSSLLYEIVWARVWILVIGNSTYAFSLILMNMLLGIGLGSIFFSGLFRNRPARLLHFGFAQALIGLLAYTFIPYLEGLAIGITAILQIKFLTYYQFLLVKVLATAIIILPVSIVFGATLPIISNVLVQHLKQMGREVGKLYFVNTLGSILGSFLTGFFLIRLLGSQPTLKLGITLNITLALCSVLVFDRENRGRFLRVLTVSLVVLVTFLTYQSEDWSPSVFDRGYSISGRDVEIKDRVTLIKYLEDYQYYREFFNEGLDATVSVLNNGYHTKLVINGKVDASNTTDMSTQYLLGFLPLALKPHAERAFVLGAGSGTTARVLVEAESIKSVDLLEIESSVIEAGKFFKDVNHGVYAHPKLNVIINDGRNHLLREQGKYDLISAEPSNLWISGIPNLFTEDFFELGKSRLKPRGIYLQWLQLYRLTDDSFKMVLDTFHRVFPHMQVYTSLTSDMFLIGSPDPIVIDPEWIEHLILTNPYPSELRKYLAFEGPEDLAGMYLVGEKSLSAYGGPGAVLHTDDHPYLEFAAARGLFMGGGTIFNDLMDLKVANNDYVPRGMEQLFQSADPHYHVARFYYERGTYGPALTQVQKALERNPDDPHSKHIKGLVLAAQDQDQGIEILEGLWAEHSEIVQGVPILAEAMLEQGRLDIVGRLLEQPNRDKSQVMLFHKIAMRYYLAIGDSDLAFDELVGALNYIDQARNPKIEFGWLSREVVNFANMGGYNERLTQELENIIKRHPSYIWHSILAEIHFVGGDCQSAIEYYKLMQQTVITSRSALLHLSSCYMELDYSSQARQSLEWALELYPEETKFTDLYEQLPD